jgi:membrane-associated phospholipid phosphatase
MTMRGTVRGCAQGTGWQVEPAVIVRSSGFAHASRVERWRSCVTQLIAVLVLGSGVASAEGPQNEPVPEPPETNWASLLKDAGRDFVSFPKRPSTWVFFAAGGALALAAHPADDYVEAHIVGNTTAGRIFSTGKVLGSAGFQAGSALTLYFVGRHLTPKDDPRTHRLTHIGFDLIRTQIVAQSIVHGIKYSVQRNRPTGECCAFPSGHATNAFAAASVLERHFGYRGSWPALVVASYVATSRLVDDRHFLSDVVFGAALGEAIGWTVVGRHRTSKFALQPVPIRGGMMVAFVRTAD